jgi:hypothetical protein
LARKRSITCVVSAASLHAALASHQTRELEMSRQKLPLAVMSAEGWDTSPGNALRG